MCVGVVRSQYSTHLIFHDILLGRIRTHRRCEYTHGWHEYTYGSWNGLLKTQMAIVVLMAETHSVHTRLVGVDGSRQQNTPVVEQFRRLL